MLTQKTLRRVGWYYHIQMPLKLVQLMRSLHYDYNSFLDTFCRLPDLNTLSAKRPVSTKKERVLVMLAYYAWIAYLLAGITVLFTNILLGILFILCTPLLVAGVVYIAVFTYQLLRNPSFEKIAGVSLKMPKPDSKKRKK